MAERTPFEDTVRRTFDANVRYWESVSRAATDYMESVSRIMTDAPMSWKPGTMSWSWPRSEPTKRTAATLVLEGSVGAEARTMLMISNDLTRDAEASVVILPLRGPDGALASVSVQVEPKTLSLAAGARAPVTLSVRITDELTPGADYTSEVSVPGLAAAGVPIVVRRRV